jgi:hypothetical protein
MDLSKTTFLGNLAVDLAAIAALAYGIYFRRHRRRDLLMAYVTFNVALFIVVTVLAYGHAKVGIAIGLGLFGALSLIRLRSEELSYVEVAYFFSALALAIINGLGLSDRLDAAMLNGVLLATVYAVDRVAPPRNVQRMRMVLDEVYSDAMLLGAELERRLGAEIVELNIREIDFVRETTELDARYRPREQSEATDLPVVLHNGHEATR